MDPHDRPKLPPTVYRSIESSQIKIDEYYWKKLQDLQVSVAAATVVRLGFPDLKPIPPEPKRPDALRSVITAYARNLFSAEAARYPVDSSLENHLARLEERITERVLRTITALEAAGNTRFRNASLAHHGLSIQQMRDTASGEIKLAIDGRIAQVSTKPKIEAIPAHSASRESTDSVEPLSEQIDRLRNECDVSAEKIAEFLHVVPRSIYKHLAGQTVPRREHIEAYQRLFSERLKRPVALKVQRKVRKRARVAKKSEKGQ